MHFCSSSISSTKQRKLVAIQYDESQNFIINSQIFYNRQKPFYLATKKESNAPNSVNQRMSHNFYMNRSFVRKGNKRKRSGRLVQLAAQLSLLILYLSLNLLMPHVSGQLINLFPTHAASVPDNFYQTNDENKAYDGNMNSGVTGDNDITCNDSLSITVSPVTDIGTLVLLNKVNRFFEGDLQISSQGNPIQTLTNIGFSGAIDINKTSVTQLTFVFLQYYENGTLQTGCNHKTEWKEIRVYKERELTLFNSYTIDKAHGSQTVVGDLDEITGLSIASHSINEVQINGNGSIAPGFKIQFLSPFAIGQISLAQRDQISTSYRVRLFAGTAILVADETFDNVQSNKNLVNVVPSIPLVQTIIVDIDQTGLTQMEIRKIFIFEYLQSPCQNVDVYPYQSSTDTFLNSVPIKTMIVGSQANSRSIPFRRDWSDGCTGVTINYSISAGTLPIYLEVVATNLGTTTEQYNIRVKTSPLPTVADIGQHTFTIDFHLVDTASNTLITAAGVSSWQVTINVEECSAVEINDQSLNDLAVTVNGTPHTLTYAWPTQDAAASPKSCGSYGIQMHYLALPIISINMNGEVDFDVTLQAPDDTYLGVTPAQYVEVYLVDFPQATPAVLGPFQVTVFPDCSTTMIQNSSTYGISNIVHSLFKSASYPRLEPVSNTPNCSLLNYTLEEVQAGAIAPPTRLSIATVIASQIIFAIQAPEMLSHVGTYNFRLAVRNDADPNATKLYFPFTLTIMGCTETQIDPISLQNIVYRQEDSPSLVQIYFPLPVSPQDPVCGDPFYYTLDTNVLSPNLSISQTPISVLSSGVIELDTSGGMSQSFNNQVYDIGLDVYYADYGSLLPPKTFYFKVIIHDCVATRVNSISLGLANQVVILNDPEIQIALPAPTYIEPLFYCGPIEYSIVESYPFVNSLSNASGTWQLKIEATSNNEIGTWPITINAHLGQFSGTAAVQVAQENLTIINSCTDTLANIFSIQPMAQQVGDPTVLQQFAGTSRSDLTDCGLFEYTLTGPDLTILNLKTITEPSATSLGLFELELNATLDNQVNTYSYTLQIGLLNYPAVPKTQIQFLVNVTERPNSAPAFTSPVANSVQLTKLVAQNSSQQTSLPVELWNFFLPSFEDSNPQDSVTLTVDLGTLSSFASYDSSNQIISIEDLNSQSVQSGNHEIKLTLDDGTVQVQTTVLIKINEQVYVPQSENETNSETGSQNESDNQPSNSTKNETSSVQQENSEFASQGIETTSETQNFGGVEYTWQVPLRKFEKKQPKPLRLILRSLSPTGNLTIAFNKPIKVPPIFEQHILNRERETLDPENDKKFTTNARLLEIQQIDPFQLLKDIIEVKLLHSDEADNDQKDKNPYVVYYNVTRFVESAIDLQILWHKPDVLTSDISRPDQMQVWFKTNSMFVDQRDYQKLEKDDSKLVVDIVPQITQQEMDDLVETANQVQEAVNAFTTFEIILYTLMASGLKYLWNLINILQFLVFMQKWRVSIPYKTLIWLQTLKAIALFEFVPKKWFIDSISGIFGFEVSQKDEESHGSLELEGHTDAELSQKTNIVENMGMMLLLAFVLLLVMLGLGLARFAIYYDYRIFRLYQTVKQRIFYNAIIRYILQSTLKLQIASADTIVAEWLLASVLGTQLNFAKMIVPIMIVGFLTACPFIFVYILCKNRPQLPYLPMQRRFGTLYLGLNAFEGPVEWASFSFLIRRSCFVFLTYAMMSFPGIQVQIFCFMSVLYLILVNQMTYYGTNLMINLENFNEFFFLVICYHFVLYCNLIMYQSVKDMVGKSLISILAFMIIVNTVVVAKVCLQDYCHKLKIKYMKRNQEKQVKIMRLKRNQQYLRARKKAAMLDASDESIFEQKVPVSLKIDKSESSKKLVQIKSKPFTLGQKSRNHLVRGDTMDTQEEVSIRNTTNSPFVTKENQVDLKSLIYGNQADITDDAIINSNLATLDQPLYRAQKPFASLDPYQIYPNMNKQAKVKDRNARDSNLKKLIGQHNQYDTGKISQQVARDQDHSPNYDHMNPYHAHRKQQQTNDNNRQIKKDHQINQRGDSEEEQQFSVNKIWKNSQDRDQLSKKQNARWEDDLQNSNRKIQEFIRQRNRDTMLQRYTPKIDTQEMRLPRNQFK